jgi:hypothetical protein
LKKLLTILICVLAARLFAQQLVVEEPQVRFRAVDIYVDSTNVPLAAYQLEFSVTNGVAKIVGIEGGEHPAFHEPPYYDPKAIQQERVIIAAFSTDKPENLPTGKTRVATIHLQITGTSQPAYQLTLQTAADSAGNKIFATATVEEKKTQ